MHSIVTFANPGIIDSRTWSTFGISAKVTTNPLGMFGTGLKYAIAVLVREGRQIWIETPDKTYRFTSAPTAFRGQHFNQILCNGEPLAFTTHYGFKWQLWQAYRELYSNCIDEGGALGEEGETKIHAELGDIDPTQVFIDPNRKPLIQTEACDVFSGQSKCIFFRGIRAYDFSTASTMYTYNIKQKIDISEDRSIKYLFEADSIMARTLCLTENENYIRNIAFQSKDYFEAHLLFNGVNLSDLVCKIVAPTLREPYYIQPSLKEAILRKLGESPYNIRSPSQHEQLVIARATNFLERLERPVTFPIVVATNLGSGTLACADHKSNQILLSPQVLTQGTKQVTSTLLEEQIHLQEGFSDCTYQMQSYLFDQIVTLGEILLNEPL